MNHNALQSKDCLFNHVQPLKLDAWTFERGHKKQFRIEMSFISGRVLTARYSPVLRVRRFLDKGWDEARQRGMHRTASNGMLGCVISILTLPPANMGLCTDPCRLVGLFALPC